MAKGIGNGVPLAAVTTRMEIAKALTQRIHFNTFAREPGLHGGGIGGAGRDRRVMAFRRIRASSAGA